MVLDDKEMESLMARKKAIQDTLAAQSGCGSGACGGGGCAVPAAPAVKLASSHWPQVAAAVAVAGMLFWAVVVWLR